MNEQKNVCNIIWIDDDIDTLLNESKLRILEKKGFNLIGAVRTFTDFVNLMDLSYDRVDAVITDANFSSNSLFPKDDRDLSGLVSVSSCIVAYNKKRDIPFYLYTGRGEFLDEKYEDGEIDYFRKNQRYFIKGQFDEMLEQIRTDVEHINSPSFRIKNKYAAELRAAASIEGNDISLMKALLAEESRDWKMTEDYFNLMRNIVDSLFSACKKCGIIPDVGELNQISNFLANNNNDTYVMTHEIMPKPLARGLWYFLDITQDGSHKKENLQLKVGEYVRETQNINLFRSVLYIAMDLCLWYETCKEEMKSSEYKQKWERKVVVSGEENVGGAVFEYEGIVRKCEENGRFYCGRYLLENPNYEEGDKVQIIKSIENKNRFKFYSEEGCEVDRFVYLSNIKKCTK